MQLWALTNMTTERSIAAGSDGSEGPLWDPFVEALIPNPFHAYDRLRTDNPVYWDSMLQAWMLTRYEDVRQVLLDDNFRTNNLSEAVRLISVKLRKDYTALCKAVEVVLFFRNGEEHLRDRRTLSRVMVNMPLGRLEPVIRDIAASLAANLEKRDEFDAYEDYAAWMPAFVMTRILGLRESDAAVFLELAINFTRVFDIIPTPLFITLNKNAEAIFDILSRRIEAALADGAETGLSIIYEGAAGEGEAKLTEAAALAYFMFMVGTETTSSLISSCIRVLVNSPDLYARLRQDSSLTERFVAEVNRLESAVQRSFRLANRDCIIGGQKIHRDDRVFLLLGAANRDPAKFARPSELNLDRGDSENVAFGAGKHYCLGANLSRLEARIAVEQLLRMRPIGPSERPPEWYLGRAVRRVKSLPVRFVEARS